MVNKILKIAIICLCFSTKPLFAQDGTNVNHQDNDSSSSLISASYDIETREARRIEDLLSLISASYTGDIETVKSSLVAGANVNHQHEWVSGFTALIIASMRGHVDIVRLLLDAGADVNLQDKFGETALWYASKNHHIEIERLLREAGATE